jgi:hypothetical protein
MTIFNWYELIGPLVCFPILFRLVRKEMDISIGALLMIFVGSMLPFLNITIVSYLSDWAWADKVLFKKVEK